MQDRQCWLAGARGARGSDVWPASFPFLKGLPGVTRPGPTEGTGGWEHGGEEGGTRTSNLQQLSASSSVSAHAVLKSFFQRGAFYPYQIKTTSKWQNRQQVFHSDAAWGNEKLFTFVLFFFKFTKLF